jgi:DNA polymerase III alpha subunit
MKFKSDIDIDFGDRTTILSLLQHTPASIIRDNKLVKHTTGVYFTEIPKDPFSGQAALDHTDAEDRGYLKLDFLNVSLYNQIKSEQHLIDLMNKEPDWDKLYDREFFEQLIHVGNHYDTLIKMPEAVNTIPRLSMFLAIIRPAKRHLIGKSWKEVAETIWEKTEDGVYGFKRSHSVAYAHLVCVHMNLCCEK